MSFEEFIEDEFTLLTHPDVQANVKILSRYKLSAPRGRGELFLEALSQIKTNRGTASVGTYHRPGQALFQNISRRVNQAPRIYGLKAVPPENFLFANFVVVKGASYSEAATVAFVFTGEVFNPRAQDTITRINPQIVSHYLSRL